MLGGGEILFQSGPGDGWILNSYSKHVPHPYGLCIAEEAFQRNFIPSDTDFRIFRDFAGIPGLDMAFIKNGWVIKELVLYESFFTFTNFSLILLFAISLFQGLSYKMGQIVRNTTRFYSAYG